MEIVKQEKNTPVYEKAEMREPTVQDMIAAERASGAKEGAAFEAALIAQCCTFDGKKIVMEDVIKMGMDDFFQLKDCLLGGALTALVKQFLNSPESADLLPKQS
jgi:hypothetical protein